MMRILILGIMLTCQAMSVYGARVDQFWNTGVMTDAQRAVFPTKADFERVFTPWSKTCGVPIVHARNIALKFIAQTPALVADALDFLQTDIVFGAKATADVAWPKHKDDILAQLRANATTTTLTRFAEIVDDVLNPPVAGGGHGGGGGGGGVEAPEEASKLLAAAKAYVPKEGETKLIEMSDDEMRTLAKYVHDHSADIRVAAAVKEKPITNVPAEDSFKTSLQGSDLSIYIAMAKKEQVINVVVREKMVKKGGKNRTVEVRIGNFLENMHRFY